jgi:hypothetical protein
MSRTIEVVVSAKGEIQIDAVGFRGADCESATQFLEAALGEIADKQHKPERHQQQSKQQRLNQ